MSKLPTKKILAELNKVLKSHPHPTPVELVEFYLSVEEHALLELGTYTKEARDGITSLSEPVILHALYILRFKSLPRFATTVAKWREEIVGSFLRRISRLVKRSVGNFTKAEYEEYFSDALTHGDILEVFNKELAAKNLRKYAITQEELDRLLPQVRLFVEKLAVLFSTQLPAPMEALVDKLFVTGTTGLPYTIWVSSKPNNHSAKNIARQALAASAKSEPR